MTKLNISKKRLGKIQQIIKEEFDKEWNRRNLIEIVEEDDISTICESARQQIRIQEGFFAQMGAKLKGLGAKAAAAGGNMGAAFKMAAAAAKGDEQAVAQLGSQLQDVNLAGQIKQATTLIQSFNKKQQELYKDFSENFVKLGLTEIPEVEELVMQLMQAQDQIPPQLEAIVSKIENSAKQVQDVAKKTDAQEVAKNAADQGGMTPDGTFKKGGVEIKGSGGRRSVPPDPTEKGKDDKDDKKKKSGGGVAAAAKELGGALGLT